MRDPKMCLMLVLVLLVSWACTPAGEDSGEDDETPPAAPGGETAEGSITPEPIPPGYDFPADRTTLQALVDANDVPAMRTHAWNLWGGMTADSTSTFENQTLPIWETWLGTNEVFTDPPTEKTGTTTLRAPSRSFSDPSQFSHVARAQGLSAEEDLVVAFVKFDPAMVQYLWEGHSAPDAPGPFYYTSKTSLTALNNSWSEGTALIDRKVSGAPARSIEIKPVLQIVKANQLTAFPFWQGPAESTDATNPTPTTWTHCVLIDPSQTSTSLTPATQEQFDQADKSQSPACLAANALYGGLNMIYSFKMNAQEAEDYKAEQRAPAEAGDYAVLAAMHVNTKEIIDWTWQTFWWQGGQNTPDNFPGSTDNMIAKVQNEWRNYAMCTAYSQTTEPDNQGNMRVCFNPFLETSKGIPDGIQSNCVTCHGTARIPQNPDPTNPYPPNYDQPIDFGDPAYFTGDTKTDFSWAMPFNAK